jgi:hypothetical protein
MDRAQSAAPWRLCGSAGLTRAHSNHCFRCTFGTAPERTGRCAGSGGFLIQASQNLTVLAVSMATLPPCCAYRL